MTLKRLEKLATEKGCRLEKRPSGHYYIFKGKEAVLNKDGMPAFRSLASVEKELTDGALTTRGLIRF